MSKIKAKGVILKYGDTASPTTTIPQHAEVTFGARGIDLVDLTGKQLPLRRDQGKVQLGHRL
jgi:hypothetical protein